MCRAGRLCLPALLSLVAAPFAALGQTPDTLKAAATVDSATVWLAESRDLIKEGDYDRAIEVLKRTIAKSGGQPDRLREAYLQLIKTYVFLGNDLKFRPQGREASNLNYQEAKRVIAECLKIPELRHTRPEPASAYPPEMIAFFNETRASIFGSFRVSGLEPRNATVLLDGRVLAAPAGETHVGDVDIPIGAHAVTVRAVGFKDVSDAIMISPSATLERRYALVKRRSATWYGTRAGAAAGVVGGLVALLANGGSKGSSAEPLPGAPSPPSR